MRISRSKEMQFIAYALSKYGNRTDESRPALPPAWLNTKVWKEAYELFFDALGDGRTIDTFRTSLKNARDAFDGYMDSGRAGWVDYSAGGRPYRQEGMVKETLEQWDDQDEEAVKEVVLEILARGPTEPEGKLRTEGGKKVYVSWRYERRAENRKDAIRIHGLKCMACEFDFSERYGEYGEGYIEVHHAMPLAEHGRRETDPETDLLVLCSNCHRMTHRRKGTCLTLDELKSHLRKGKAA